MKPILVFSQQELIHELKDKHDLPDHLISIGNPRFSWSPQVSLLPGMPRLFRKHFRRILRLEFFDVERQDQQGKIRPFKIPKPEHAAAVVRFWEQTHTKANGYVVHCHAGISRSTAVALALLFQETRNEDLALKELMAVRQQALPNRLLVRHFDERLGSKLLHGTNSLHDSWAKREKDWFYQEIGDLIEEFSEAEE